MKLLCLLIFIYLFSLFVWGFFSFFFLFSFFLSFVVVVFFVFFFRGGGLWVGVVVGVVMVALHRQTDRQTDRQANRQTDRQIDGQRADNLDPDLNGTQNVAITANMPIYTNYFKICDRRSPSSLFHPQQHCGLEEEEKMNRAAAQTTEATPCSPA